MTQPHPETPASLRILAVVNLPWDVRLGAVRVYSELAECWRAAGHSVSIFSLAEAFPGSNPSNAGFAVRQLLFAYKADRFVRRNAGRFDVVDAAIGSLSGSKNKLGFGGLLVARSVGLYRLYQRVENEAAHHWPRPPRGKPFGRVFYGLLRLWSNRISDRAIRSADLVNVPNEQEAHCLRKEFGLDGQIVVQPYGLTAEQRSALSEAAAPAAVRLAEKRISFIGMWAPRKGAFDWPAILRAVRRRVPEARFRFLGATVDEQKVRSDLGKENSESIEVIPLYPSEELPNLLADCAVGAFPSYVEGFGLGVIEQLAARIPTVAFSVPGPGDILRGLPELLVPAMDVDKFGEALCSILELSPSAYEALGLRVAELASAFDWATIAQNTIATYRRRLREQNSDRKILFIQPFSLGSSGGGGGRILRALLEDAPLPWQSICSSPRPPRQWLNETHLPSRPSWGKIEASRLAWIPNGTMSIFVRRFRRRLKSFVLKSNASAIHTVPHAGLDFVHVQAVARELSLPFFVSLHDDLAYTTARELPASIREPAIASAWSEADARFVISEALGQEYSRRYGTQPYRVVTDGLRDVPAVRRASAGNGFRIYFMGLFHLAYEQNLRALLEALVILEGEHPGMVSSVTCRCEYIRRHVWSDVKKIDVLPFATEDEIAHDMSSADLLYMPMPFGDDHENFTRYSVSTKMVTYIGSGIPIIYHGPPMSAAFTLLQRENAAVFLTTLDPQQIAKSLVQLTESVRDTLVANALALARRDFMLADQAHKFWGAICDRMTRR